MDIELENGMSIPILGLGTYGLRGSKGENAIKFALENGYRHVDTAAMYNNEMIVGDAIRKVEMSRDRIFVTTKVWSSDLGYRNTQKAINSSLSKLQLEQIDLYLIHWPSRDRSARLESWQAMLEAQDNNTLKAIGVSNFSIKQLEEIYDEYGHYPVMNQVEFNPFSYKQELLDFCNSNKIRITAYSPLNKGNKLNHATIKDLSNKYEKTSTQIILKWIIQKDIVAIPKSSHKNRILENANIFDFTLDEKDVYKLDNIS